MAQTVRDIMTANPVVLQGSEPVGEAARRMREADVGAVLVVDDGGLAGIVTDRDITIRVTAEGRDPGTPLRDAASTTGIETVTPDTSVDKAVDLMRTNAVRRLPVVENGQPVGIVSIGDLAVERDSDSALADISAATGNT